jgi:hypothetical protein
MAEEAKQEQNKEQMKEREVLSPDKIGSPAEVLEQNLLND